jgi:hypothetical protein
MSCTQAALDPFSWMGIWVGVCVDLHTKTHLIDEALMGRGSFGFWVHAIQPLKNVSCQKHQYRSGPLLDNRVESMIRA